LQSQSGPKPKFVFIVHENVLGKWIKEFAADPQQAFPGQAQLKPEQQEPLDVSQPRALEGHAARC
jgi:hypothetical protein